MLTLLGLKHILLDTGANNNYLDRKVYNHFKDHIEEIEGKNSFFGIDGNKVVNDKIKLTFKFEDEEYPTIFDVLPEKTGLDQIENEGEIQIHGILGSLFFMEHKWIIDFAELKIYSKDN